MVMIGFTLSKINLLIFVTAMFVIIAYFTLGFSDVLLKERASQLVVRYSDEVITLINSKSLCTHTSITVPPSLNSLGGQQLFYIIRIEKLDALSSGQPNKLIFSIAKRREPNIILAARSIDTFANIYLFALPGTRTDQYPQSIPPVASSQIEGDLANADIPGIVIDPQARTPVDSFFAAKETFNGQDFVYLVNCSSAFGGCNSPSIHVGNIIKTARGQSTCVEGAERTVVG